MHYRPRACSLAEVRWSYQQGLLARRQGRIGHRDDEDPQILSQPGQPPPEQIECWLWADGTLRGAPEKVVEGSPLDRPWVLTDG